MQEYQARKTDESTDSLKLWPQFKNLNGQNMLLKAYDQALAELWQVPYEEMDIKTDFGAVHVLVSGAEENPPLFLLHGRSSTSLNWYQTIKELSAHFRVFYVDVLGDWGKSIPVNPPRTEEQAAACLEQIMLGSNAPQAFVCGLSYGGFLAANLALKKPTLVKKLILLAPAGTILPLSFRFYCTTMMCFVIPARDIISNNIKAFTFKGSYGSPLLSDLRYYGFRYGETSNLKVYPRVFKDQELMSLSMPTMLLVGKQEMIYNPVKLINRAATLIPDFKGELLEDCCHSIYTDQPDLLVEKMKEFLLQTK